MNFSESLKLLSKAIEGGSRDSQNDELLEGLTQLNKKLQNFLSTISKKKRSVVLQIRKISSHTFLSIKRHSKEKLIGLRDILYSDEIVRAPPLVA